MGDTFPKHLSNSDYSNPAFYYTGTRNLGPLDLGRAESDPCAFWVQGLARLLESVWVCLTVHG